MCRALSRPGLFGAAPRRTASCDDDVEDSRFAAPAILPAGMLPDRAKMLLARAKHLCPSLRVSFILTEMVWDESAQRVRDRLRGASTLPATRGVDRLCPTTPLFRLPL